MGLVCEDRKIWQGVRVEGIIAGVEVSSFYEMVREVSRVWLRISLWIGFGYLGRVFKTLSQLYLHGIVIHRRSCNMRKTVRTTSQPRSPEAFCDHFPTHSFNTLLEIVLHDEAWTLKSLVSL
jgi:hypothetical protein